MILSKAERDRTKDKLLERIFSFVSCLYSIDDLEEAHYEIQRLRTLMEKAKEDAEWSHFRPMEGER
jgi:hypothetical protein